PVKSHYRLSQGAVGIEVGEYDRDAELIVDPTIVYSTHLGGSQTDQATGVAVDPGGAVYVTGYTTSIEFPGATQASGSFVTKLNPQGNSIVYSTMFGGPGGNTRTEGIAVDTGGNAYIYGETGPDFPTKNAVQPVYGGGGDMFAAKLNAAG